MANSFQERIIGIATKEFPVHMAGATTYWRTIGPFHFIYTYDEDGGEVYLDMFGWRLYKAECEPEMELKDWYDHD